MVSLQGGWQLIQSVGYVDGCMDKWVGEQMKENHLRDTFLLKGDDSASF